jgi:hypothetical protein
MENYCLKHPTLTYDGIDVDGSVTKGGFSNAMITLQRWEGYCNLSNFLLLQ